MTAKEYDDFVERFDAEGIDSLCAKMDEDGNALDTYFSRRPCDICHRSLGGDRQYCEAIYQPDGEIMEVSVCVDCYYFAEYGRLDDTTMAEVHLDRQQNPAPMQEE